MSNTIMRYPGGKTKLATKIIKNLNLNPDREYREPFFGGGSVGLGVIRSGTIKSVWLNDADPAIAAFWTSVIRYPQELCALVKDFTPSVGAFDEFKAELLSDDSPPFIHQEVVRLGFKKLAIHQMSYSGLGTMSGGPLGGRAQQSAYKVDCRWSPEHITRGIQNCHDLFSTVEVRYGRCTCFDFITVVRHEGSPAVLYLDPPYYEKGSMLYQHTFTEWDHQRLATALLACPHEWLLSYDDCQTTRNLYAWASVQNISANYTIAGSRKTDELIISRPAGVSVPCLFA